VWRCLCDTKFCRWLNPTCDRRSDRQKDGRTHSHSIHRSIDGKTLRRQNADNFSWNSGPRRLCQPYWRNIVLMLGQHSLSPARSSTEHSCAWFRCTILTIAQVLIAVARFQTSNFWTPIVMLRITAERLSRLSFNRTPSVYIHMSDHSVAPWCLQVALL